MIKASCLIMLLGFMSCDGTLNLKNKCVLARLKKDKETPEYASVMKAFRDTFVTWRSNIDLFGVRDYLQFQVDDPLFFSKERDACVLILLSRTDKDSVVFGGARVINGIQFNGGWRFNANQAFSFSKDYFEKYQDNSFENLAEIARYCVLKEGNPPRPGCEIDESYWFK